MQPACMYYKSDLNYTKIMIYRKLKSCGLGLLLIFTLVFNIKCAKTLQAHRLPDNQVKGQDVRIYVFRPSFVGTAVSTNVYENNVIAGRIGPKSYLAWDTKPGDITLEGGFDFVKIEAKPGKTYYFRLRPKLSAITPKFSIMNISEQEGKAYLSKLKEPKVKVVS